MATAPQSSRIFRWLNLLFWVVFTFGCLLRNAHQSSLTDLNAKFDQYVLTPLGFYHRGWGMFPSLTKGASLARVKLVYRDDSEEIEDYYPLRSRWYPDVYNEVMEDIFWGHDTNANDEIRRRGYFLFTCKTQHSIDPAAGPLKSISFESSYVPLYQLFTNFGEPYKKLSYSSFRSFKCP